MGTPVGWGRRGGKEHSIVLTSKGTSGQLEALDEDDDKPALYNWITRSSSHSLHNMNTYNCLGLSNFILTKMNLS